MIPIYIRFGRVVNELFLPKLIMRKIPVVAMVTGIGKIFTNLMYDFKIPIIKYIFCENFMANALSVKKLCFAKVKNPENPVLAKIRKIFTFSAITSERLDQFSIWSEVWTREVHGFKMIYDSIDNFDIFYWDFGPVTYIFRPFRLPSNQNVLRNKSYIFE